MLTSTGEGVHVSVEFLAHVFREALGIKSIEMLFYYICVEVMPLDLRPYVFICL